MVGKTNLSLLIHTVARTCVAIIVVAAKNDRSTLTESSVRLGTIRIVCTPGSTVRGTKLGYDVLHRARNDGYPAKGQC